VARVALGDRRGIRALKEAVSFVSHRPRQSDDGEQRLTIERARKAYCDMLEHSNKDNEITAWLTYFSETVLTAQQNTLTRLEFYLAKTRLYDCLRGKLNERQEKVLARIFRERIDGFEGWLER
jgi:Fic family protein